MLVVAFLILKIEECLTHDRKQNDYYFVAFILKLNMSFLRQEPYSALLGIPNVWYIVFSHKTLSLIAWGWHLALCAIDCHRIPVVPAQDGRVSSRHRKCAVNVGQTYANGRNIILKVVLRMKSFKSSGKWFGNINAL